jgi:hypothetical protein
MRIAIVGVLSLLVFSSGACKGPYDGVQAEKLPMPKKKPPKEKKEGPLSSEPDTCKADFTANPVQVSKSTRRTANGLAQDADNQMAGIETAPAEQKKAMVLDALSTTTSALRSDPYNPGATFTMAVAYAWAGKKKCSIMMIERLAELSKNPDVVDEATKFAGKVKKHPAFEAFRKDAEAALGN